MRHFDDIQKENEIFGEKGWTMKSFTPLWELLWEEGGGSMR